MTDFEPITDENISIEAFDVWQTPLFVTKNPYHDLIKDELISVIRNDVAASKNEIKSGVATSAKRHLVESDLTFLDNEDSNIQTLAVYLTELINTIAQLINEPFWPPGSESDTKITESWYHVTDNGGFHDAHSHPNCSWCGIYYLAPGESDLTTRNGVNRFYDPRVNADHYLDAGSRYLNGTGIWDFEPGEGQVVIFPSYLKHSALPYFGQEQRIVIAFNACVQLADE